MRHFLSQLNLNRLQWIQFSPFDLQVIMRIGIFLVAWKFLSTDYSAFTDLLAGPDLMETNPPVLAKAIHFYRNILFDAEWKVRLLQVLGGISLLSSLWQLSRGLVITGLIFVMLFEWNADLYRAPLYDLDFTCSILFIAAAWPASWKKILKNAAESPGSDLDQVTPSASQLGIALTLYAAGCYFISGLSKFGTDPTWWNHVHLEWLYLAMEIWHGMVFPDWLHPMALGMHQVLMKYPAFGILLAFITELVELLWPLSLVFPIARRILPLTMLGIHVMIFAGSGILFLGMAVMGIALIIPWRYFQAGNIIDAIKATTTIQKSDQVIFPIFQPKKWCITVTAILVLCTTPSLLNNYYFPFANYNHFGFQYNGLDEVQTTLRLAYKDPENGTIRYIPMNYGGFFDFRLLSEAQVAIRPWILSAPGQRRDGYFHKIQQYARAVRSYNSNQWLLGNLALPYHIVAQSYPIPGPWLDETYIVLGVFQYTPKQLSSKWFITSPHPIFSRPKETAGNKALI
ncbi:MAG: hypothetical protein KTR14_08630 [Vampirovibrio sp.]|nr:hypothetical protein [Vampirovibrio sp.]